MNIHLILAYADDVNLIGDYIRTVKERIYVIKCINFRWVDHVTRMEECRSAFKILTGTPIGKLPLESPMHSWEDNIRMDLKEIVINTRNWIDSAQDRGYWRAFVNVALSLRVT